MTGALRTRWQACSPRERRAWLGALALIVAAGYAGLLGAGLEARGPLYRNVQALRAESTRMQQHARELGQLRRLPASPASAETLRASVQSALDASPLSGTPSRLDAPDPEHVVLVFEGVAFADWLRWIEGLAARRIRLDACRIEALPDTGQVSVTVTLARVQPP